MTVNDLIAALQALPPEQRELPVFVPANEAYCAPATHIDVRAVDERAPARWPARVEITTVDG